jgi:hypothetical protein
MWHNMTRGLFMVAVLLCMIGAVELVQAEEMGWIPMDPAEYQFFMVEQPQEAFQALPKSYDWRTHEAVTVAKDQANCGSCWAFAVTGAFESHIRILFHETLDLSEQKLISCDSPPNKGCCGGRLSAIRFYEKELPRLERCYPYGDADFFSKHKRCPPYSDVKCSESCTPVNYNAKGFYTINAGDANQVNASIYQDGPAPVGFTVYEDFVTYWDSPLGTAPWTDGVYFHNSGGKRGGHAVLAFGWDDTQQCYLMKNSWGATTGPFGDGTFKMRYDQISQAVNFTVVEGSGSIGTLGVIPYVEKPNISVDYSITIWGGKGLTIQAGDPFGGTDTVVMKVKQESPDKETDKQKVLYKSLLRPEFCATALDKWDTDSNHAVSLPDFTKGTLTIKILDTADVGYPKNALVKLITEDGAFLYVKVIKGTETCRVSDTVPETRPEETAGHDFESEVRQELIREPPLP